MLLVYAVAETNQPGNRKRRSKNHINTEQPFALSDGRMEDRTSADYHQTHTIQPCRPSGRTISQSAIISFIVIQRYKVS
jgi:hypothetical protein